MSNTQKLCQPNETPMAFDVWREQRIKESPHFQYWSTTLDFKLSILSFVISLREGNFQLYIETLNSLLLGSLHLTIPITAGSCQYI